MTMAHGQNTQHEAIRSLHALLLWRTRTPRESLSRRYDRGPYEAHILRDTARVP